VEQEVDFCIQYVRLDFAGLALSGANAPAPPKWEPLAVHAKCIFLPRPLPLGEVDLRSKDGEGEAVFLHIRTLFYPKTLHNASVFVIFSG
jgi:hypothetical protein